MSGESYPGVMTRIRILSHRRVQEFKARNSYMNSFLLRRPFALQLSLRLSYWKIGEKNHQNNSHTANYDLSPEMSRAFLRKVLEICCRISDGTSLQVNNVNFNPNLFQSFRQHFTCYSKCTIYYRNNYCHGL